LRCSLLARTRVLKAEQDAGAVRLRDAAAADARSADEAKVLSTSPLSRDYLETQRLSMRI